MLVWHVRISRVFEITLTYLGIRNQLINCHISLNYASRYLVRAYRGATTLEVLS